MRETAVKWAPRARGVLLGGRGKPGLLPKAFVTYLLICTGFVFLFPILYMISSSLKDVADLVDPTVVMIPRKFYTENYVRAFAVLDFFPVLLKTLYKSAVPAVLQAVTCGLTGLALAKYRVPFKGAIIGIILITFVTPIQVIMIPQYIMFTNLSLTGGILPFALPALTAGGFNASLFCLIYWQYFRSIPDSYLEAAELDGAGVFGVFFRVILPLAVPAIITVFLFALVWGWNESYVTSLYMNDANATLPRALSNFVASYRQLYGAGGGGGSDINESIRMAGTMLVIAPLLLLYAFAQRFFVEVIDRAGITGE
jgi:multiple sugar transport system permease protein